MVPQQVHEELTKAMGPISEEVVAEVGGDAVRASTEEIIGINNVGETRMWG